jgi:hypothetical protein
MAGFLRPLSATIPRARPENPMKNERESDVKRWVNPAARNDEANPSPPAPRVWRMDRLACGDVRTASAVDA